MPQTYEALSASPRSPGLRLQSEGDLPAGKGGHPGWLAQASDRSGVGKHGIEVWDREMEKATAALRQDAARRALVRPRAAAPRAHRRSGPGEPRERSELVAYLRAAREFLQGCEARATPGHRDEGN